jgi:hypothetical protein
MDDMHERQVSVGICFLHCCARAVSLCGLVVRVLGYRSGGPGLIPGTTRFSGKREKEKRKQ